MDDVTNSPAFQKWFAGSKVVDSAGKPMVVYHGTGATFDAFDLKRSSKSDIKGVFFAFSPDLAMGFGVGRNLISAYLRIKNPATFVDVTNVAKSGVKVTGIHTALKKLGFDGIFDRDRRLAVAFDPKQIKSADKNSGTFSGKTTNIFEADPYADTDHYLNPDYNNGRYPLRVISAQLEPVWAFTIQFPPGMGAEHTAYSLERHPLIGSANVEMLRHKSGVSYAGTVLKVTVDTPVRTAAVKALKTALGTDAVLIADYRGHGTKFESRVPGPFEEQVELRFLESETPLRERKFERLSNGTQVYLNPTIEELELALGRRRMFLDRRAKGLLEGANAFVWNDEQASHQYVIEKLKLKANVAFYVHWIEEGKYGFELSEWTIPGANSNLILKNKNLKRMIGGESPMMMDDELVATGRPAKGGLKRWDDDSGEWTPYEESEYQAFRQYTASGRLDEFGLPGFLKEKLEFIKSLAAATGKNLSSLLRVFSAKSVFKVFTKIGWSLVRLWDMLRSGFKVYEKVMRTISEYVAKSKVGKWTEEALTKLDGYLTSHPVLRALGGPAIAGMLLYIWLNMSFTGNFSYDFDFSSILQALVGKYSLAALFAGPEGTKMLMLLATGMLGLTFPWPGPTHIKFLVALTTGLLKLRKGVT